MRFRHPANIARYDRNALGQRIADQVTGFMGSWRFIILQTVLITVWIGLNVIGLSLRWDPAPFVLLNLVFSVQAAYASPLILLAQNMAAEHDRDRAEENYRCDREQLELLRRLVAELDG